MPIGKNRVTWPHRTNILTPIGVVQEHATIVTVSIDAVVVAGIVRVGNVNGRVNDAEIMLALLSMDTSLLFAYGM